MAFGKKQKLQAEAEAARQAQEQNVVRKPRIIREKPMIAPVAKPTKRIMLSPIVQPVAMVPYNTEDESIIDYDTDY